jgi:hypothetical protein
MVSSRMRGISLAKEGRASRQARVRIMHDVRMMVTNPSLIVPNCGKQVILDIPKKQKL